MVPMPRSRSYDADPNNSPLPRHPTVRCYMDAREDDFAWWAGARFLPAPRPGTRAPRCCTTATAVTTATSSPPRGSAEHVRKVFARPIDEASRRGTRGRLKDALTGQGPDVFVVTAGNLCDLRDEWPSRARWSGWDRLGLRWMPGEEKGWVREPGGTERKDMRDFAWTEKAGRWRVYDFRTRRYDQLRWETVIRSGEDAWWDRGWPGDGEWEMDEVWWTTMSGYASEWLGGRAR